MPIKNQDIRNLYGGLDYRIVYNSESDSPYKDLQYDISQPLYWTSSKNVESFNGLLQPMKGNTPMLATPISGGILGMFQYEVNNALYLMFNGGDGKFYQFNGAGIAPTVRNSGLNTTAKCNYTQYLQKMIVCNGVNDAFIYDGSVVTPTITDTGLYAVRGVYGKVCCSYSNRLWIADGANLYYSDLGDPTQWVDDPSTNKFGGYIDNFMGNTDSITGLYDFGVYMAIFTSNHIYLLTGNDVSNFAIEGFEEAGSSSPNGALHFNGTHYFFNNINMNVNAIQIGSGGWSNNAQSGSDTGQLNFGSSITDRIHIELASIMDITSLQDIVFARYPNKNQIWMYFKQNNITDLSAAWVFDFQYFTTKGLIPIYLREMTPANCAVEYNKQVYTGTSSSSSVPGQIYLEDSGNTISSIYGGNGIWYDFFVNFPKMEFGQSGLYKTIESIKTMVNSTRTNNFNFNINYQGMYQHIDSKLINVSNNIFMLGTNSLGDGFVLGQNVDLPAIIPSGAEFNSIQVGVSGTTVQNDFGLRTFSFYNIQELQGI